MEWLRRLFGQRTIAIECEFCKWENNYYEESDCNHCKGTGLIILKTYTIKPLQDIFKVAWIK